MKNEELDKKYAELLIKKCLVNNGCKPLVIVIENDDLELFAQMCYEKALDNGFTDVTIFNKKAKEVSKYLLETDIDAISKNDLLDRSILEDSAKKEANYLFLGSYQEGLWLGVTGAKMDKFRSIVNKQLDTYFTNTSNLKCPWCVACYPTIEWAKKVYPNMNEKTAYDLLYQNIMKMCLCDKENPMLEWDKIRRRNTEIIDKLNDMSIERLHYSNQLGTNLDIYLPEKHIWLGADDRDYYGNSFVANMPAYEIFTAPNYLKTEGVVYSSLPLNCTKVIDSFGLEFKKGAVSQIYTTNPDDYKILSSIVESDENSKYLGECAIVENNTPVCKTNTLYYNLSFDENSSSHLALGTAYPDSILNGLDMTDEELLAEGANVSCEHMDFMIGTDDLVIEADTKIGKRLLFSNGRFKV